MTYVAIEKRRMHAIYHTHYKVVPAGFARGFWVGICRACLSVTPDESAKPYASAKSGSPEQAEKAVLAHLRDKHDIDPSQPPKEKS